MSSTPEHDEAVRHLERQAQGLRSLLAGREPKRPLIIEFTGSAKAGKTMAISTLRLFLRRNGLSVEALVERASVCPLPSKGSFDFNAWVTFTSLTGLQESIHKADLDVFILDRGLFDGLVWNTWLQRTGKITTHEAKVLSDLLTLPHWTDRIDLVCLMTCAPVESIKRELTGQLTTKRGSIMDETILGQLREALDESVKRYRNAFKKIITVDTTATTGIQGVTAITKATLDALQDFLDEPTLVLPRKALNIDLPKRGFVHDPKILIEVERTVEKAAFVKRRLEAEADPDLLIPIPCGVVTIDDKVLLLRRREPGHSLHDTLAVWAGGHLKDTDAQNPGAVMNGLRRELSEEIEIKDKYDVIPLGLVRTSEDERASRHIGLLYQVRLSTPEVALARHQREFRETRGTSMSGQLIPIGKVADLREHMGDWSKFIVDRLWPPQGTLFSADAISKAKKRNKDGTSGPNEHFDTSSVEPHTS